MNSKILKYLSFILIIIISGGILLSTFVFIRFNSIVQNFENGILIYSFFTLYICAVMLPILFRKKLKILFQHTADKIGITMQILEFI